MVEFLKANWFEILVAGYVLLGVLGPAVAKFAPKVGNGMSAVGLEVGRLLAMARPGWTPPALPKADDK